ncbi:hypothetical protein BV898_12743 [Hypsibius exemplaris]|uniref:Uncharacterized protein n=1 Tax=Hypsibius exemplaris TaxID=2072580 RepID=A0A1W0WCU7_HYPEX|nr:hypothetical protein BV898_12743 [Hypsibius exemplaris]
MLLTDDSTAMMWMTAGIVSVFLVMGMLILCAEYRRKQSSANSEPVQLVYKQSTAEYQMPNVSLRTANGHLSHLDPRAYSPTWRNSSLSRELPAIPDVPGSPGEPSGSGAVGGGDIRYESASNLYACLDDVRVNNNNHGSGSNNNDRSTPLPYPNGDTRPLLNRVHPYDRIGGPTVPVSVGSIVVSTSQRHAQVLQQMDNETVYRGGRSDISYTSVTVRAPLSEFDNHLYAQVGGEYGGSVESQPLGPSGHIYNELYAEIDVLSNGPGPAHYSSLISPYATSASVQAGGAIAAAADEDDNDDEVERISKLYAKVRKPSRGSGGKNSFPVDDVRNLPSTSGGVHRGRRVTAPVTLTDPVRVELAQRPVTPNSVARASSGRSLQASVDAAIADMDTSVSDFVSGDGDRHLLAVNGSALRAAATGTGPYKKREHPYEVVKDA